MILLSNMRQLIANHNAIIYLNILCSLSTPLVTRPSNEGCIVDLMLR